MGSTSEVVVDEVDNLRSTNDRYRILSLKDRYRIASLSLVYLVVEQNQNYLESL